MSIKTHEVSKNWIPLPRYLFRKKNILRELRKISGLKSFIDFGCGAGDLACTISEQGLIGEAYDFSESAINVANSIKQKKGLADEQIIFKQSTKEIKKYNKKVDLVLCLEVLEHVENDKELYSNLVRLAKKNIIISVPAKRDLFDASDEMAGHFRRYNREDLVSMLESVNVDSYKIISYGYPFNNMVRKLRESKARKQEVDKRTAEDKSKQSGIHIFKVSSLLRFLYLEKTILPFYWISLLFNKTDLSEGYLVVATKK